MQERKSKCFIAATANNVHQIPPEFLRKGRFDELFFVDLPNKEERRCIFGVHLKRRGLTPANFDLDELASCTNGFSGAEIEQAIIAALYSAASKHIALTTELIIEEINFTKPLSMIRAEDIERLREWARERTIPA